jgi:hypothetical protein
MSVAVNYDVAEMHTNSQQHSSVIGSAAIAYLHLALDLRRAFHSFDHTTEFCKDAVAHDLYDSTAMSFDRGGDKFGAVGLERSERPGFICAHKPAVAGHVGCEDGDQPPFNMRPGHRTGPHAPHLLNKFMARRQACLLR